MSIPRSLIAVFAAAALFGVGAPAIVPVPAQAEVAEEGAGDAECPDWLDIFDVACEDAKEEDGGGGGESSDEGGDFLDLDQEEVVEVRDPVRARDSRIPVGPCTLPRFCGNPQTISNFGWDYGDEVAVPGPKTRAWKKREEEKDYLACLRERKNAPPGKKPLCPYYCPAQDRFLSPLDRNQDCRVDTRPTYSAPRPTLEEEFQVLRYCQDVARRLAGVKAMARRMRGAATYSERIWWGHGWGEYEAELHNQRWDGMCRAALAQT